MRKIWAFKTFTNAALLTLTFYPLPFFWNKFVGKSIKITQNPSLFQMQYMAYSVASSSPNHDINDFDGIPRKFGVVDIFNSLFLSRIQWAKKGVKLGTIFSFIKKMLLKFPFSAFTLSKLNATIFFAQFKYIKAFWGVFFQISL